MDYTIEGETVTVKKGMYDCFQSDINLLSSEKLEYINSDLRNKLIK